MKTSAKLFSIITILLLTSLNTFSTPLNGTYTVGSGGNYPTISLAYSDADLNGINGPVIFEVITGTYNETIWMEFYNGSSPVNTITLTSQSGNPDDVIINGTHDFIFHIWSSNLIFDKLTLGSSSSRVDLFFASNITFSNNKFNGGSLISDPLYHMSHIIISGNDNLGSIDFRGVDFNSPIRDIQILNNNISGHLLLKFCHDSRIEKNTIGNGITTEDFGGYIIKNKITGYLYNDGPSQVYYYNNFIIGYVHMFFFQFLNNTVVGGSLSIPTLYGFAGYFENNLIINPLGGTVLSAFHTTGSDYNNYYNGGNNNLAVIGATSYNNLVDLYNATGDEQHSISKQVYFQTPTDLHLALSSLGDQQLAGIPNSLISDDIDGDTRSFTNPYKGADEVTDFPLPVELTSFTSSVNNNNVNLNWTTASEINNSGFDIERQEASGKTQNIWNKISFINGHGTTTSPNNYEFTDKNLPSGKYNYRLKQIDFNGNFEYFNLSNEVVIGVPSKFELSQNYPNPFNPTTKISYELPFDGKVSLKVFDISGKEVMNLTNEIKSAGYYEETVNGSNLSSGVYFYRLSVDGNGQSFVATKKMMVLK